MLYIILSIYNIFIKVLVLDSAKLAALETEVLYEDTKLTFFKLSQY